MHTDDKVLLRAQGSLLGQLVGDALGSLVEFQSPQEIRRQYPQGVRELSDGGTWGTIAGQPTDDSEMALILARTLIQQKRYDPEEARKAYLFWLDSAPFDCGGTIASGLRGRPDHESQANGAMMRVSPLGIFGTRFQAAQVSCWAQQDAALTHPHPVCLQANALFAMAVAHTIRTGNSPREIYELIKKWAAEMGAQTPLMTVIEDAFTSPPSDYVHQQGWVLIAFQNSLWQLLHAANLEEGIVDTIMRGGDTDTNAAIAGALLGAVYGLDAVPERWREKVLNCRPEAGQPHVRHPRPQCFWPVDSLYLASCLVTGGTL